MFIVIALAWRRKAALNLNESWPSSGDRKIRRGRLSLLPQQCPSQATQDSLWTSTACTVSIAKSDQMSLALYPAVQLHSRFTLSPTALGVQQPSLLGASPAVYSQQSALAAASLSNQSAANYQLSQQTAALQQQAAAAAAAALQQVSHKRVMLSTVRRVCLFPGHIWRSLLLPPFCFF